MPAPITTVSSSHPCDSQPPIVSEDSANGESPGCGSLCVGMKIIDTENTTAASDSAEPEKRAISAALVKGPRAHQDRAGLP